jgi:tRNA nucleotidyltransferase (CCA-adding enzyme)
VRDLLLGNVVKDIDLVLDGSGRRGSLSDAVRFASVLARATGGRLKRHDRFGTATVALPAGDSIDVAAARREFYEHPGALPHVAVAQSIEEDLRRRDFTIHAMALEIAPGRATRLIDPLGGRRDLARRRLVILHPRSFEDDPTRAFRLVRYANRLGMTVEATTRQVLAAAVRAACFDRVSGQRIRRELELLFSEPGREGAFRWMRRLGLAETLSPALQVTARVLARARELERKSRGRRNPPGWFAFLLVWTTDLSSEQSASLANRLALSGLQAASLRRWPSVLETLLDKDSVLPSSLAELKLTHDEKAAADTILEGRARRDFARAVRREGITLGIHGRDLLASGLRPGPDIGRALERTLAARRDGRISKAQELKFALRVSVEGRR